MAKVFRIVSFIVGGLGVIGSFIVANQPKVSTILSVKVETEFNFFVFIAALIATILCSLIFYGFGAILEGQASLLSAQNRILEKLAKSEEHTPAHSGPTVGRQDHATVSHPVQSAQQNKPTSTGGVYFSSQSGLPWTCRNCGTSNSSTRDTCEECGKKR